MEDHQRITIGQVLTTHGYRGEIKVMPLTDYPERFYTMEEVYLAKEGIVRKLGIDSVRPFKHLILLKFKEVQSAEEAAIFRGGLLQVDAKDLVQLPEGHYYHFQLIGLHVFSVAGEEIGRLTDIYQTGANDVYAVASRSGTILLIPALKKVVKEIDLANKRITVEMLPGL
ncbi:MAG: ribosome maturation factor RimM [Syntrophomonadaceae bacterium]|nr:ribosome maturation factor RimM [Syntrophomonadaceae bacterium]